MRLARAWNQATMASGRGTAIMSAALRVGEHAQHGEAREKPSTARTLASVITATTRWERMSASTGDRSAAG